MIQYLSTAVKCLECYSLKVPKGALITESQETIKCIPDS